ncbi:hypothetical protein [Singulisphaera sp. PoT]|uniref:hypothetical protein n=1 Tax=Singulisphaera sp. PoT TaxID=3411797 RepID=UPI003BF5CF77
MKTPASRANGARPLRQSGLALAFTFTALIPVACGPSGPELAKVTGTVTYQGKPVPKGRITFVSTQEGGRNATGELGSDGSYRLQTENPGDGALLGNYNVTIYAHDEPILDYIPRKPVKPKILTPEKYEKPDTSGLSRKVKSGSNTFDFDLTD